ncbi:GNAT family N-acetyltransferase [Paenibacillus sp. N1-5-1-14]|uniref:GNAT family N-acetyltransferase n=1 Tax=Paenibacillus radicibacter TaxID=2972488 RepID=UPI0021592162|nr:GNAT family N-acetyltransferase [Paenibacillus radicibacter]MCR8642352.1 GNAT family N-acetyltransferase [Paenibacillus radicibacter]
MVNQYEGHGRTQLTTEELNQVEALMKICQTHDKVTMKLNWSMLRERSGDVVNDFVYVDNGQIIGFLGLYSFGTVEIEVSGMVHPDYRRQGIFTKLLKMAMEESIKRKYSKVLLICPGNSESAKAFIGSTTGKYEFSEHYMERNSNDAGEVVVPSTVETSIRLARYPEDRDVLIQSNMEAFEMTHDDAAEYVDQCAKSKDDLTFIADLDGVPISKIGVMVRKDSIFIFGFGVSKSMRGQGHGRNILNQTIAYGQQQLGKPNAALEVAVTNSGALGLYESCGFVHMRSIDYYAICAVTSNGVK